MTNFNTVVLFDVENLLGEPARWKQAATELSFNDIIAQLRRDGSGLIGGFAVSRAYANWGLPFMSTLRREMTENGVEPRQIFAYGAGAKQNAADIELVIDALDLAYSRPGVTTFVLVTRDGGFASLGRKLHELGKAVVVCADAQCSKALRARTRRDLLDIVREVDERVEQVFTQAYADVSAAFDTTFARLFPGGEGRLVLTDPDDMLATGVEVEARPPGKKVKRLSLLSGGERSLVAVAFLVALFKARPSPFYILDEVEAALDDTNLGRLLEIYEELRESSQLLVITHQKRTMEVGDALYGVTMRGDGVSAVIGRRLREDQPA